MSKNELKKRKKRERETRAKVLRRKKAIQKKKKREAEELELERKEASLDREIQRKSDLLSPVVSERKRSIPRHLLPGPNKPCICGKKNEAGVPVKYKKCCQKEIEGGRIRVIAKEDPSLEPDETEKKKGD